MSSFISHILLPVDFSGYSGMAYKAAVEIAQKTRARITLLHVIQPQYNFASEVSEMMKELEEHSLKRLKNLAESSPGKKVAELEIDQVVSVGMAGETILEQIKDKDADLVVMGGKGKSGIEKALFGSVTEMVMFQSPVPVLVVPETKKFSDLRSILFATDYRYGDPNNLKKIVELAKMFDADVDVLHVAKNLDFETEIRHRGFANIISEDEHYDKLRFSLARNEDLNEGISDHAAENPTSLIVVNRYRKKVLETLFRASHAKKLGSYARLPLLVLPVE